MKRFVSFVICLVLLSLSLLSCERGNASITNEKSDLIQLSQLVGVWADYNDRALYRFSPVGGWYRYTEEGEVDAKGTLSLEGDTLKLTSDSSEDPIYLTVENKDHLMDEENGSLHRVDAQFALSKADDFKPYFTTWYEEGDLEGNTLKIAAASRWTYADPDGKEIEEGTFTVFSEEENTPYLFTDKEEFYATLSLSETGLILKRFVRGAETETVFCLEENSTAVYAYFKDKKIDINYELGSGPRLLRNGGAAYNDQRDYKRMSVNCGMDLENYREENERAYVDLVVQYTFRKSDLPAMTGRIYNAVRFAQYDYYTGKIFTMNDSTGDEVIECVWDTEYNGESCRIECAFSSAWEYVGSEEVLVKWVGTYRLAMPASYDGLVICLRPVYNSYSAQMNTEQGISQDMLALDDLGEDAEKCLLCRIRPGEISVPDSINANDAPEESDR
ncbi:MAG: hypothetical protein J6Z79_02855 [Clostridia bacterium]|nr:hypothetical protein [Clostridia bacterium]